MMRIILVRHGETEDNVNGICQGQTHGQLSDKGLRQSRLVAEHLSEIELDVFYSSDLGRAVQTCKIITSKMKIPATTDSRLRERYFDKLQGGLMTENWNGFADYEGSESIDALKERTENLIEEIKQKHKNRTILIVGHGVTLLMLISVCLKCDVEHLKSLENSSITTLQSIDNQLFDVVEYNNVSHLNDKI